jgi:hypothetical protein
MMVAAAACLVIFGGSRLRLVMFFAASLLWALLGRRRTLLISLAAAAITVIVILNLRPNAVKKLPLRMQRTLSVLVQADYYHDIHKIVRASDMWHYDLIKLGIRNWLGSARSFVLGNRIHRFDESIYLGHSASIRMRAELAARMGSYEAGLWATLAVLGVMGAILYAGVFWVILRPIVPDLWNHGINDPARAFSFLAVSGIIIWTVFSWIAGSFPSSELMMAIIARAAYDDKRRIGSLHSQEGSSRDEKTSDTAG